MNEDDLKSRSLRQWSLIIGIGWLISGIALAVPGLPLRFLLKEQLRLTPDVIATFFFIGHFPSYIKPIYGILTDAVPFFGTLRRHYLLLAIGVGGLLWLILGLVPRTYVPLLTTYCILYAFLNLLTAVMGGLMVDVGKRYSATGRLGAERVAISRSIEFLSGPLGGFLSKQPFLWTALLSASLHFLLTGFYTKNLKEERAVNAGKRKETLEEVKHQFLTLKRNKILWIAAGLVALVEISPGFGTPLLFIQQDVLKFDKQFIGNLAFVTAAGALLAAVVYRSLCRKFPLQQMLAVSIVVHTLGTLFYFGYTDHTRALLITFFNGITLTLSVLPLYDLSARATPKGSGALGYSIMMSVWNFSLALSDVIGSYLYTRWKFTFTNLIWLNAGTTLAVLLVVPFLPKVLVSRRDHETTP